MRLLYVFVEFIGYDGTVKPYRGIDYIEMSFSKKERFSYDRKTNVLHCYPRVPAIPTNFWAADNKKSNIYNISVFAGENGTGKTTVIQYIIDLLYSLYSNGNVHGKTERHDVFKNRNIVIFEEKSGGHGKKIVFDLHSQFDLLHNLQKNGKVELDKNFSNATIISNYNNYDFAFNNGYTFSEQLKQLKVVYLSNMLSLRDFDLHQVEHGRDHRKYFVYNCSPGANLAEGVSSYYPFEIYKQVKYVFDKQQYAIRKKLRQRNVFLPMPQSLAITLRRKAYSPNFKKLFPTTILEYPNIEQESFWQSHPNISLAIWLCALCVLAFEKNISLDNHSFNEDSTFYHVCGGKTVASVEEEFIDHLKITSEICVKSETNNDYQKKVRDLECSSSEFIRFVLGEVNGLFQFAEYRGNGDGDPIFDLPVKALIENDNEIMLEKLSFFIRSYRSTCRPNYTIHYSWGLSSGEENLLRVFASLHHIFERANSSEPVKQSIGIYNEDIFGKVQCKSLFIFFDEADLTFHPEWQQQLIYILVMALPYMYPKSIINDIQVFLSTHSPLLLGDIPSENVIYLPQGKKYTIHTFGQNIHSILRNSFFLNHGTIGFFAAEKINGVARELDNICSIIHEQPISREESNTYMSTVGKLSACKATIDLVAPGILKNKLLQLYDEACIAVFGKTERRSANIAEDAKKLTTEELELRIKTFHAELNRRKND